MQTSAGRPENDIAPPIPPRGPNATASSSSQVENSPSAIKSSLSKGLHVFLYEPADYPNGLFVHVASTTRYNARSSIVLKTSASEKPISQGMIEIQVRASDDSDIVPVIDKRHPGVFGILLDSELLKMPTSEDVRPGAFGKLRGGFLGILSRAFGGQSTDVNVTVTVTLPNLFPENSGSKRQRFMTLEASDGSISVDHRGLSTGQLPDNIFFKTTNAPIWFFGAHELEEVVLETTNATIHAYDLTGLHFGGDGPTIPTTASFKTSGGKIHLSDVNSFTSIQAENSNGKIVLSSTSGSNLSLKTSNAKIRLSEITAGSLSAQTSMAKIKAYRVQGRQTSLKTSYNSVSVSESNFTDSLKVETSSGKVKILGTTTPELKIEPYNATVVISRVRVSRLLQVKSTYSSITVGEKEAPLVIANSSASGFEPIKIDLKTSSSPLNLFLSGYEGTFSCSAVYSKVEVAGEGAVLTTFEEDRKVGYIGAITGSGIQIENSNSKCILIFV
ncbi:hypothetical protein BJ742DRAFT_214755 [Cladochytrium replicatum]|nr:hypothetical protein BJ742DRAFT_214755 [Cladochytrium replicatum]